MTKKEYIPAYPDLGEQGEKKAEELIIGFKEQLKKVAEETIGELYCDMSLWLEGDAWVNFRQYIFEQICDYGNKGNAPHRYKKLRQAILTENRKEIIKDLNQDLLEENQKLKNSLKEVRKNYYDAIRRY